MRIFVKQTIISAVLGILLLAGPRAARADGNKIDESQVKALLKEVDDACVKKDAAALMKLMTPDARVTVVMKAAQGKKNKIEWTRAEYEAQLKQSMAVMEDYKYERKEVKISMAENGLSAKATSVIFEQATIKGKKITSENHETATITMKDGKLLVEKLDDDLVSLKSE